MPTNPLLIDVAVSNMNTWIDLPESAFKATVHLFARKLPLGDLFIAIDIAHAKFPWGGEDAFKYFCGICHNKIREEQLRQSWTEPTSHDR
jgi:hypothetical protein